MRLWSNNCSQNIEKISIFIVESSPVQFFLPQSLVDGMALLYKPQQYLCSKRVLFATPPWSLHYTIFNVSFTVEHLFPAARPIPKSSSPWPWANQAQHPSGHFPAKNYGTEGFPLSLWVSIRQHQRRLVLTHIVEGSLLPRLVHHLPIKWLL